MINLSMEMGSALFSEAPTFRRYVYRYLYSSFILGYMLRCFLHKKHYLMDYNCLLGLHGLLLMIGDVSYGLKTFPFTQLVGTCFFYRMMLKL